MRKARKRNNLVKIATALLLAFLSLFSFLFTYNVSAESGLLTNIKIEKFYETGVGTNDFALHVYVFNPAKKLIVDSPRNKIQIGYANNDEDIFRTNYYKYSLSVVEDKDYYTLFKIDGFKQPSDDVRYYAISGIEILTGNNANATEYISSSVYRCETKDGINYISTNTLPTVEVDVKHTFYRTDFSSKNINKVLNTTGNVFYDRAFKGWGNQISSCYFAIPETLIEEKNTVLESVTAEFYNYFTKPILITNSQTAYEAYEQWLHRPITDNNLAFYGNSHGNYYDRALLADAFGNFFSTKITFDKIEQIDWLFKDDSANFTSSDYSFDGENLKEYFDNYALKYSREEAINQLMLSATEYTKGNYNLAGFNYGYNRHTYSISDTPELEDDVLSLSVSFADTYSWKWILGDKTVDEQISLSPLVKVDNNDVSLTNAEFSKKYYIDKNSVNDIKSFITTNIVNNKETWILRYDVCEYYGRAPEGTKISSILPDELKNNPLFLAQESVYLDFDILSFRYAQDNNKYSIANTISPKDVFNDLTKTPEPKSWWQRLLELLGAWGVLILSIVISIVTLMFALKLMNGALNINSITLKIIVLLLIVGAVIVIGYFGTNLAVNTISNLGGLW